MAPLTTEQCEILGAILDPDADAPDRTTDTVAKRVDLSPAQVRSRLEELQARSPSLVRFTYDEEWHVQAWSPTGAARDAYEKGCRL